MGERAQIEIRKNENGSLDEIVIRVKGQCVFHLEQLASNQWWMGCYETQRGYPVMVTLSAKGTITAHVNDERPAVTKEDGNG